MWRVRGILLLLVLSVLGLGLTAVVGLQSNGEIARIENHARLASAAFLICLFAQAWIVLYTWSTAGLAASRSRELAQGLRRGILWPVVTALVLLLTVVVLGSLTYSGAVPRSSHTVLAWIVLPAQFFALVYGGRRLLKLEALLLSI